MAKAAACPSLSDPSTRPVTRSPISASVRAAPSRLRRMSSDGARAAAPVTSGIVRPARPGPGGPEGRGAEGQGQELAERGGDAHALGPAEMDGRARARELGELLAASAAGGQELGALAEHERLDDLLVAGGDHRPDGGRLG